MKKFLLVSIVWGGTPKTTTQLQPILDLAEDWAAYGGSNYFLYTSEDSYVWQGRFMAVITFTQDRFFISEITNVHDTAGYFPEWVWKWLRDPRINDLPYALLPPPTHQ
jgi:hypothetical protein